MRSAGKASIPIFAPMPPGVDVAVTASTPPKSFRSRPMWPMASIVGAPCWPLKYMISEAHDTRLPGACPKISWVIRCVRLSANAYGGFRPRIGDCSFQVNDRSNRRAPLTARTNSSGDGRVCAAAGPAMATVPATLAAAVSHSRRDTVPIRSSLASGFANPAPGGRPTDTRSRYRTQPPTTAHAPSPLAWRAAPRLCCTPGRRGHGAEGQSDDDRSGPSLLRRPRRGRRSRRAARRGDVPADLRRLPGVFRARLPRTAAHRRDADGVQPALRSARDDHQRDRARESPPPEPRRPLEHGSRARRRPHGLDGPAHALPVRQPTLAHRQLVQAGAGDRSEEHTSELQSPCNLVCRLLLEKKKKPMLEHPTHSALSHTLRCSELLPDT